MGLIQRHYQSDPDKLAMIALARKFPQGNLHVGDLPYRLSSWVLDDPQNVALWFNEQELVGWAVLQTPFWTVDYVCHPTYEAELHAVILEWADRRAAEVRGTTYFVPSWFINVFPSQTDRIRDLEAKGFACQADVGEDSWSKVLMRRSGDAPVKDYSAPKGFIIRALGGETEVPAYVELHRSVFQSKNMTVEWRIRTLLSPGYRPELDVVVVSAEEKPVAFCICWFDAVSREGRVEPLGCHQDYRRFALGRVALSAGLQRLQAIGAKEIYVETDSYRNTAFRLYESFGFNVIQDVLVYRKDYPQV